mmetsp:Transcript_32770/g.101477  ORF Transcript_32770/g.101477 Transcript_32770/m.101477 type:complete len:268 (-) Transcript_32770:222-1025(-)
MSHGTLRSPSDASTSSRSFWGAPFQISGYSSRFSRPSAFLAFWTVAQNTASRSSQLANPKIEPPPRSTNSAFRIVEPSLMRCRSSCSPTSAPRTPRVWRPKTKGTSRRGPGRAARRRRALAAPAGPSTGSRRRRCRASAAAPLSRLFLRRSAAQSPAPAGRARTRRSRRSRALGDAPRVCVRPVYIERPAAAEPRRYKPLTVAAVSRAPWRSRRPWPASSARLSPGWCRGMRDLPAATMHSMNLAPEIRGSKRSAPIDAPSDATTAS